MVKLSLVRLGSVMFGYYDYKWGLIGSFPTTKVLYKRHEENKRKTTTTNVIDLLHECKKRTPCTKALPAHESSKVEGRGKREEEGQERQRPGGGLKKQPKKVKHIGETKTWPT